MEDTILHARTVLLALPEEKLDDSNDLIVPSLLNIIHSFSKINKVRVLFRHKPVTEAKAEEIAFELSKILFYTGCLVHLLDVETDIFDLDRIEEFSGELDPNYTQDNILCALYGIQTIIEISENLYYDESLENLGLETISEPAEPEGKTSENIGGLNVLQLEAGPGESDIDVSVDNESSIASLYACVWILCESLELDINVVMANVKTINKFQI